MPPVATSTTNTIRLAVNGSDSLVDVADESGPLGCAGLLDKSCTGSRGPASTELRVLVGASPIFIAMLNSLCHKERTGSPVQLAIPSILEGTERRD